MANAASDRSFPPSTHRAIVVGAGISGLTAAFRLRQQGFDVTVLESTDAVGGKMSCYREDGYTMNRASSLLSGSYTTIKTLIDEVGLSSTVGEGLIVLGIPRDGQLQRLRASPLGLIIDGLRTPLLSFRSKLLLRRVLIDGLKMRKTLTFENISESARFDVESVADYCKRRLNPELSEYLVEPTCRAIYTVNAEALSVVDFFFALFNNVAGGSLAYPAGIDFLVQALSARLTVKTSSTVTHVEQDADGVSVTWTADGTDHSERVDACVIAIEGKFVPGLYPQLDPVQSEILANHVKYSVNYGGHFALRHKPEEAATLIEVPKSEDDGLCVIVVNHNTEPGSTPNGAGLVSGYWTVDWCIAHSKMTDEEVIAEMLPAMEKFLPGITENILFTHLDRWDPGVAMTFPGWYAQVRRFMERFNETDRVQLAGDFMQAPGTNACALSGERAASRLVSARSSAQTQQRPWQVQAAHQPQAA